MDIQEMMKLMDHFDASQSVCLKVTEGNLSITLKKAGAYPPKTMPAVAAPLAAVAQPAQTDATSVSMEAPAAEAKAEAPEGVTINAPLVGTFYHASSPESEPFIAIGQEIKKGQTIGLIEAMKMMSEVPAPFDCVIEEILVENGALAAYDEPLVRVREL